jgi:hypothetical protein
MKLCYCDESGTGDEPIAVMVGIIVDAQRMHVTKEHWGDLLTGLSRVVGRAIDEISAYTKLILYFSPKFLMTSSTYWTR